MAAGMGSRYGGLKQIEPVGPSGEAIIDYSIYDALRAGFSKLVFILRKEIEQPFREAIGSRFEKRVAVEYVFQELDKIPAPFTVPAGRTKPWGTTQAILVAASAIREPFAAINADDFYGAASYRLLAQHLRPEVEDYAMVGFILRNTLSEFGSVARGICRVDAEDYLESIVEMTSIAQTGDTKTRESQTSDSPAGSAIRNTDAEGRVTLLTGNEPVSMNMWGFTPRIFPQLAERFEAFLRQNTADLKRECYIPSTVNDLLAAGQARVKVLRTPDSWFGVTYREDHPRVVESIRTLIRSGAYPERLWA
jgi:hypothetical protein